jgi:hypothetical protein
MQRNVGTTQVSIEITHGTVMEFGKNSNPIPWLGKAAITNRFDGRAMRITDENSARKS